MITPKFSIEQSQDFITLNIECPHIRAREVEFYINGREFHFHAKPYLLKLELPGEIIEDGRESASYDVVAGKLTVKVPKVLPGEDFQGLDLISKLLMGSGANVNTVKDVKNQQPLIQVMDDDNVDEDEDLGAEFSIIPENTLNMNDSEGILSDSGLFDLACKYGFNDMYSSFFKRFPEQMNEILEISSDPDVSSHETKRKERMELEDARFDEDAFLFDLVDEDDAVLRASVYKPWFLALKVPKSLDQEMETLNLAAPEKQDSCSDAQSVELFSFTDMEKEIMRRLGIKKSTIKYSPLIKQKSLWNGMIDILLAYLYELRVTESDFNVESGWTISKLSATLSCLEQFENSSQVFYTSARRILTYPLIRSFEMLAVIYQDLLHLLRLGKRPILRIFIRLFQIFEHDDLRYLVNTLYLEDYICWLQACDEDDFKDFATELQGTVRLVGIRDELYEEWKIDELMKKFYEEEDDEASQSSEDDTGSDEDDSDSCED